MPNEHNAPAPANPVAQTSLSPDRRAMLAGIGGLAAGALFLSARSAQAGPLEPPDGPVASTGKTTQEIFDKVAAVESRTAINSANTPGTATSLFKITQPGSYYLTGNITGEAGKHGIEIAASGVMLDLNGFDIVGIPAMGQFSGVKVTVQSLFNIAVVNGSVRNWGDEGVDLGTFASLNCRVEGVLAKGNTNRGITIGGGSMLSKCSAYNNTGDGIRTSIGCTVSNCSALLNTGVGISTSSGCTLIDCTVSDNTGTGLSVGTSSTVANCSVLRNGLGGILTGGDGTVTNCTAVLNNGTGIQTGVVSKIAGCSASRNTNFGISTSDGCSVFACTVALNTNSGIAVGVGCTVADCTSRANSRDGINCVSECVIRGNTCSFNGNGGTGSGIVAVIDNRIEGNSCSTADSGIAVSGPGNIIIRNTCTGNTTDWVITGNNVVGPILDRRAPASAAISGFSAPSSLGATDPNANFSY